MKGLGPGSPGGNRIGLLIAVSLGALAVWLLWLRARPSDPAGAGPRVPPAAQEPGPRAGLAAASLDGPPGGAARELVEAQGRPASQVAPGADDRAPADPRLLVQLFSADPRVDLSAADVRLRSLETAWSRLAQSAEPAGAFVAELPTLPFEVCAGLDGWGGEQIVGDLEELAFDGDLGTYTLLLELAAWRSLGGEVVTQLGAELGSEGWVYYHLNDRGDPPETLEQLLALPAARGGRVPVGTDARFEIRGLVPEADYRLWASGVAGVSSPWVKAVGRTEQELRLELYPLFGLRLAPADPERDRAHACLPLSQAKWGFPVEPGLAGVGPRSVPLRWLSGAFAEARAETEAFSWFWLRWQPGESQPKTTLSVNWPGFEPMAIPSELGAVRLDQPLRQQRFELVPSAVAPGAVEVLFVDGAARPLSVGPEARIGRLTLYPEGGQGRQAEADLHGRDYPRAHVACVPAGLYRAYFVSSGGLQPGGDEDPLVAVTPGQTARVELRLEDWGSLELRLEDPRLRLRSERRFLELIERVERPELSSPGSAGLARIQVGERLELVGDPPRIDMVPVGVWSYRLGPGLIGGSGGPDSLVIRSTERTLLELR